MWRSIKQIASGTFFRMFTSFDIGQKTRQCSALDTDPELCGMVFRAGGDADEYGCDQERDRMG